MSDLRSVALVGLSGVGKSTVGRQLASRLGCPLLDTDGLIVEAAGRSIPQIFAAEGEARFRDREATALQMALGYGQCVVSTGGGIVLRQENRELLRQGAFVVWLDAPTETLVARLQAHDEARPLLQGDAPAARLEALRAARAALYAEIAHARVDVAAREVAEICDQVLQLLRSASAANLGA